MPDQPERLTYRRVIEDPASVTTGTLHKDGSLTNVRKIPLAQIKACPHLILTPQHYREDGTCRCNDPEHSEMVDFGYHWIEGHWG